MSFHLEAEQGVIGKTVFLPGDPVRAEYIANTFLKNPQCYNRVRGALGFTGTWKGTRVSVQSTGMGIPSMSIYAHELLQEYGCRRLIRLGSCGSLQEQLSLRDLILPLGACSDSNVNRLIFKGMDYAPTATFSLLYKAFEDAKILGYPVHVGNIITSDSFYNDVTTFWEPWKSYGVLAIEMETSALYTVCAKFGAECLAILTVSDHVLTGESLTSEEKEVTFEQMVTLALGLAER